MLSSFHANIHDKFLDDDPLPHVDHGSFNAVLLLCRLYFFIFRSPVIVNMTLYLPFSRARPAEVEVLYELAKIAVLLSYKYFYRCVPRKLPASSNLL